MKTLNSIALLLMFALVSLAADVTGKWVAQVPGRQGNTMETTYALKADGSTLSGTITTQRGESAISDGKIEGDNLSFIQKIEFGGNAFTFKYTGKVSGDEIKFTREREGGEGQKQEFTAKRK